MFNESNELQVYTINDVASFLKVAPRTVYKHLHDGVIKGIKMGNKWRFTHNQIKDYIQQLERKIEIKNDIED